MTGHDEGLADAIAVVGMAGRFPGADSVTAFWRNLCAGEESIVALTEAQLRAEGIDDAALGDRNYVRRAAWLGGVEEFDAEFFGLSGAAARMLDPQHRLFLQSVWHALEDAGIDPRAEDGPGTVGVYGTSSASGYLLHNLMSHLDPERVIGQGATFEMINLSLQNDKDHLATRVAHQFDFRGPALSVQTACSSSLVAVHLASQAILSGECDVAVAGGASVRVPNRVGYWHEPGSMSSPSGHCRPFDVRADGTVFGSGVGVVVLKSYQRALEDGDRVHALIRGSAVNNDGATKMTYAAPNAVGQAEVIAEAHAVAGVDASSIGYVETHGTGTPLGDPVEVDGLRQAFELAEDTRPGPCVLGSVKANIGHLEVASGIVGLIKAILCLEHRALPGTLHYTSANPELHLDRGPFEVRGQYGPWEWDGPRRAGVSSFGVGGTNAHVVLEEAPIEESRAQAAGPRVLLLSARRRDALDRARAELAADVSGPDGVDLADAAYTLATRRAEPVRLAAVARDAEHAAAVLSGTVADDDSVAIGEVPAGAEGSIRPARSAPGAAGRVVLLFPGQGAQHVGMGRGLYEAEPVFRAAVDRCAEGFAAELGFDVRETMFDGPARELERTERAQPALFTVEYAMAQLLSSRGIVPAAVLGHSIGEYVAATVAGVFDLPGAIAAVSVRARLMHAAPRGSMLAVPLSADDLAVHLTADGGADLDVATVNEPGGCVIAGTDAAVARLTARLAEHGVAARRVRTSHAFHSRLMEPVTAEFAAALARIPLREPRIPILSNVTGTWMSAEDATDPAAWARQIRATVRFADDVATVLAEHGRVLVEAGPGAALTSAAGRHPAGPRVTARCGRCATPRRTATTTRRSCSASDSCGLPASTSGGRSTVTAPRGGGSPLRVTRSRGIDTGWSTGPPRRGPGGTPIPPERHRNRLRCRVIQEVGR
ncbi:type I polyketide synthase [Tsukamurella soli]